jgi:hypothetical protein
VLETKSALVENVIEGRALDHVGGGDVLGELESLMSGLSPKLAESPGESLSHQQIRDLLSQARDKYHEERGEGDGYTSSKSVPIIPEEAIEALIKALSGPQKVCYRVESRSKSRKGNFYEITTDGADLLCSCAGFEYRGMCSHARDLKNALEAGGTLPTGVSLLDE